MKLQTEPFFNDGDLVAAQDLFNEGLNEMGTSTNNLSDIVLTYASTDRNHLIAQAIQEQWRSAFGTYISLEPVEQKVFFDRVSKKNYSLALGTWFADFNDPINFLEIPFCLTSINFSFPLKSILVSKFTYLSKPHSKGLSVLSISFA